MVEEKTLKEKLLQTKERLYSPYFVASNLLIEIPLTL
jgi:hypothetical protein